MVRRCTGFGQVFENTENYSFFKDTVYQEMSLVRQSETLKQHYSFGFFGIVCSLSVSFSLSLTYA